MIYEFTIEGDLVDLNTYINKERTNKYAAAKLKKDETEKCMIHAMQQLPKMDERQFDVEVVWYRNNRKDSDNIFFGEKFIQDGVVKAGKLKDDGYRYIRNISHKRVSTPKKEDYKTVVRFVPVEENVYE